MRLSAIIDAVLDKLPLPEPKRSSRVARAAPAALLLATGAGTALWWWTQWARGRAESEAADRAAAAAEASDPDEAWTGPEG